MNPPIQDQFTHLPVSRQRKYQLRKTAAGLCTVCGKPAAGTSKCLKHLVAYREQVRKRKHLRRRYRNCPSYRLQAGLAPLPPIKSK